MSVGHKMGGVLIETTFFSTSDGLDAVGRKGKGSDAVNVLWGCEEEKFDVNFLSKEVKTKGKKKRQKKKGKGRSEGQSSNFSREGRSVTIGFVNEKGRRLVPSLTSSSSSSVGGGVCCKNPISRGSFLAMSDGENVSLQGVSIGDSEIRKGNDRAIVEHEVSLAKKLWSFAVGELGVNGEECEAVCKEKIQALESREQAAIAKKVNQSKSQ